MLRALARALRPLTERCPWLRPLLPVALIAASWTGCHAGEGPLVAFLGDSLTSGWRLSEGEAWPAVAGRMLSERDTPIRVLNAGVSGETAAEALVRLPAVLEHDPDVLVVALGINDGLRGLPLDEAEAALRQIIEEVQTAGLPVLLVGMRLPEGGDAARVRRFDEMYPRLAAEYKVALVPNLLAGVSDRPGLLFSDGLHPNAAGHARLAETVRPHLTLVLATLEGD
jgi:acyl-CoA thioesterase-1